MQSLLYSRLQITLVIAIFASMLTGCVTRKTESVASAADANQPTYFPPAPAAPRLQFLTNFADAEQLSRHARGSFADWVVGTSPQQAASTHFDSPYGTAADHGKLYICDVGRDKVHVLDLVNNSYSTLGTENLIKNPVNLTIDSDGTRYLCDTGANQIFVFDAQDQYLRAIGQPTQWAPIDLAILGDELYICDVTGAQIWVYSKSGQHLRTISHKGKGPDELSMPTNLDVGPDGNIYVVDTMQQMIKVFDPAGRFLNAIGGPGSDIGHFARPKGIAIDPNGVVYVADSQWDVVQMFDSAGQLLMVFGEPGEQPSAMGLPAGLAIDRTSLPQFQKYLAPNFEAEYLLFVVNQFGKNKVAVFAFGRDTSLPLSNYQVKPVAPQPSPQPTDDSQPIP